MAPVQPLSDLARAEFEARLAYARAQIADAEDRAYTVARPDFGLASAAGYWSLVAFWSRQLGHHRTEWQPAQEKAVEWLVRRIEWLDAAGPPYRRKATDWETALHAAIMAGNADLQDRVLQLSADTADGSLGTVRKPLADGLRAIVAGDDDALVIAAAEASAVPDAKVTKRPGAWYPRIGAALQAIADDDSEALRVALNAMCAQHVLFATKGHLRHSQAAWTIVPVVLLLPSARRRSLVTDVDPQYHALRVGIRVGYVHEWDSEPVPQDTVVAAVTDPVPIDRFTQI